MALPKPRYNQMDSSSDDVGSFAKTLPEDCVEYSIAVVESMLDNVDIRQMLRAVQSSATSLTKRLLKGYLWQRDGFRLDIAQENGRPCLFGKTQCGESVEDEWLIVYILRELSKLHHNVWIRIIDTDGQFLLIEAANVLPKWLNPEIADFRVWINSGKLLIIPVEPRGHQEKSSKPVPKLFSLADAYSFIQQDRSKLLHSPLIEAEAFYRLEKYPGQIQESLHHALITVPRKLAYIIHQDEAYVSPAIEAFYLRDPIALLPLQTADYSTLIFAPQDLVTVSMKFTKIGYAQLTSQQFAAPSVWKTILAKQTQDDAQKSAELGMKLTSGFEMLMSDRQNRDKRQAREIQMFLEDLDSGQDGLPTDEELQDWPRRHDDESWLNIDFEAFEKELNGSQGKPASRSKDGFGDKAAQENLRKIVARFEDFLNDDTAGADGVEVLEDMDEDDDEQDSSGGEDEAGAEDLSFDEEQFATMMTEMMGLPKSKAETTENTKDSAGARIEETAQLPQSPHKFLTTAARDHLAKSEMIHQSGSTTNVHSGDFADSDDELLEEAEIRKISEAMEQELRSAGALHLYAGERSQDANSLSDIRDDQQRMLEHGKSGGVADQEDSDEIDINLNLAKNMLESLKSQAGMAGPGSNLLGLMGVHMPRDENSDSSPVPGQSVGL